MVDDTPAEASATSGCPSTRDSCPTLPGLDPIRKLSVFNIVDVFSIDADNFMDYAQDNCMTGFTPGQIARIKDQLLYFRGIAV